MNYLTYIMSWLPEPYVVINRSGRIVYRDVDHLSALYVCASLNRCAQDSP